MKLLLAMLLTVSASLAAQTPAPTVAGKWTLPLETPHGKMTLSFELKVDGKKVTGTMGNDSDSVPVSGEFADGKLRFVGKNDSGELVFSARLKDADTLVGVLSSHVGDLAGTATRLKTK